MGRRYDEVYREQRKKERIRLAKRKKRIQRIKWKRRIASFGLLFLIVFSIYKIGSKIRAPKVQEIQAETTETSELPIREPDPFVDEKIDIDANSELKDYIKVIKKRRKKDIDYEYIYNHLDEFPEDMLEMAVLQPESRHFAIGYAKNDHSIAPLTEEFHIDNPCPYYLQWDRRWGYEPYGTGIIGTHGCGPTSLAMVLTGLGHKVTPKEMGAYAEKGNFIVNGFTSWDLMEQVAVDYGLKVQSIGKPESMPDYLNEGGYIILSLKPGKFTTVGHLLVVAGVDGQGNLIINDPNSPNNSRKTWKIEEVSPDIKKIWYYSK